MKLFFFLIHLFFFLFFFNDSSQNSISYRLYSNFKAQKNKLKSSQQHITPELTHDSHNNPKVIFQGWFHYIKFSNGHIPDKFFKNPSFTQQIKYEELNKHTNKDNFIPSESHFYGVLSNTSFNVFERKDHIRGSTYDYLPLQNISPIPQDRPETGPISGLDKYKEGYCFKVPIGNNPPREIWLICMEEESKAKNLMDGFIKAKIRNQQLNGEIITSMEPGTDPTEPNVKNEEGSYWKIIKDWGECSTACGGGNQYQQLICVKENPNAMDCMGDSIRQRPCNTQPCPKSEVYAENKTNDEKMFEYAKKKVHFLPISNKPQRYDKCVIMERDALIVKDDNNKNQIQLGRKEQPEQKIPIRLVMNSKSIVAYTNDKYETPYKMWDLETTKLALIKKENQFQTSDQCFLLRDNKGTRGEICQIDSSSSGERFIDEWNREIQIFQKECKSKRTVVDVDLEFQKKVKALKDQFQRKQTQKKREESTKEEIIKLNRRKEEAEIVSLMALDKEKKLEQLLEKEEKDREINELHQLQLQMEEEKKKTGCLIETLKAKEMAEKLSTANNEIERDVGKIKTKAQKQLEEMRNKSKQRIKANMLIHKRKVQEMKTKIQNLRLETARNMKKIGHEGDASRCFIGTEEKENEIELYCGKNYMDDTNKYLDCKNYESFCFSCCEAEFGEGHISKREECYHTQCEDITLEESNNSFTGAFGSGSLIK